METSNLIPSLFKHLKEENQKLKYPITLTIEFIFKLPEIVQMQIAHSFFCIYIP